VRPSRRIAKLRGFDEFHEVDESEANVVLSPTWAQTVKNGKLAYRLRCRLFGRKEHWSKDELFCPTPAAMTSRLMLVRASVRRQGVRFFDISRAVFHSQ
jgi:hypothetical protein